MIELDVYKLKVTFLTPVLGSQPTVDVATKYIAQRNGFENLPEDEVETLPDALDKGTTVFHRNGSEAPIFFDYQVKGFLKEAGRVLNKQVHGKVRNLRHKVDTLVFVGPRKIEIHLPEDGDVDFLERPLRAETAQGPRVALARSEMIPEETWFECHLEVFPGEINEKVLIDLLDYGYYKGMGQWRNGGYGRFRYELTKEE